MTTKRRCPKCNQLNDTNAATCSACGAELIRRCPVCGTTRAWNIPRCPNCEVGADDTALFTNLFRRSPSGVLGDRYLIQETLQTNRVSAVYRAVDVNDRQLTYAIKELSPVTLIRANERRQARANLERAVARWSQVEHPGVARIVEHFEEQDRQYIVSEFISGWNGERVIEAPNVHITPELASNWGAQLCEILGHLHGQENPLYTPFMAPSHIMITPDGVVRLVGLGLGYHYGPALYGPYGSTTGYGAPELAEQFPDPQTDIFGLGRLLYALLIDKSLEKGLSRAMPLQQAVPGISKQLVRVIARAASRRRDRRYTTAQELRQALWEPVRGPLEPIDNWYQIAHRVGPDTAREQISSGRADAGRATMEDMGFSRDPRFGPRQEPRAPQPEQPAVKEKPTARLSVRPHAFDLRGLPARGIKRLVLNVRNAGEGDLTFRLVTHIDWLRAPSREVTLPPGKQAKVILSLDASRLVGGRTAKPRALAVDSNVGRQWVAVNAEIETAPALVLEQSQLDFGQIYDDSERAEKLIIRNGGRQLLTGQIVSRLPWLRVHPSTFRLGAGDQMAVESRISPDQLPNGPQHAEESLIIDSNGGQARIAVKAWRLRPRLQVDVSQIDLGTVSSGDTAEQAVSIENVGDGSLHGAARGLVPWVQMFPAEFSCEPGESVQLVMMADSTGLSDGPVRLPQAMRLQTNGGSTTLSLSLRVSAPQMVVETPRLEYGRVMHGDQAERDIVVRNTGSAPLEATVFAAVDWLKPSEERITCPPGEARRVRVAVDTAGFEHGVRLETDSAVQLAAGADIQTVGAQLTVLQPALRVEPEAVDFGYVDPLQPASASIMLRNEGTGDLAWHAQTDAEWIEIAPESGVCSEGGQVELNLTAYVLALEAGMQEGTATLVINSDGGRLKIPLQIALASPRLAVDSTLIDLGTSINREPVESSIRIFNRGLGPLRGTVRSDTLWLVVDRASFECEMGRSIALDIRTDMEEFPQGISEDRGVVYIESNGGNTEIDIRLQADERAALHPPEPVQLTIDERERPPQGRLILRNDGMATAHVELSLSTEDLVTTRDQLEIKPNKSVRVTLRWQGPMPPPLSEAFVEVRSGEERWRVPVYLPRDVDQG